MRWSSALVAAVFLAAGCGEKWGGGKTGDVVALAKQRFADALARGVDMRPGP